MKFTQQIVVPYEENWTSEDIEKALTDYNRESKHGWSLIFDSLKEIVEN
ncbi:hypothetical protein [Metabacillus arenae]|uniref:Uncharacterized protein n=1 Tax=Metabacillus arenae TaxID=2771434 RepID=A0A926NLL3_9BACI|nr:hypothetical protein [Metabacillus arenae]MBD1382950.1 hypothetical protein [Metabacillus arenae]